MIDPSQRIAARVFAIAYFLALAIIMVGFSRFYGPYMVWDSGTKSALNLAAHSSAIHIYLACAAIYGAGLIVMPAALYRCLVTAGRGLAVFATICWAMSAGMWSVFLLDLLSALRTMTEMTYRSAFDPQQLPVLAGLELASGTDAYYIGLGLNGLGLLFFSVLFLKSRYVPRTLSAFGIATSLFESICGFVYLLDRSFGTIVSVNWYEMPTMLFEVVLCGWILIRGLKQLEAGS